MTSPKPSTKKPRAKSREPAVSPRVARRERRRERSREEIVEAARRVLVRDGIAATTVDAIAREVGLTKAALYYYYPSKDALFFEVMFDSVERNAKAIREGVSKASSGGEAVRAIVRETVGTFGPHLDDFRLAFLHPQVASGAVRIGAEQLARLRPLNDIAYKGAAKLLSEDRARHPGRADVDPRLMVFLANVAALGVLTMKALERAPAMPIAVDPPFADLLRPSP